MKRLIPADTVDAEGNVWETVGENIRRGAKEFPENSMKAIADILFPVGSVYCGENPYILSVGKWKLLSTTERAVIASPTHPSGEEFNGAWHGGGNINVYSLRFWKRVS